jgi:hypothetical protein
MLSLLMHTKTAWIDYFTETPTTFQSKEYKTRLIPSDTSVHVLNCLFISITSGSDGSPLYCRSTTYLLVESTSFFSCCTSLDDGGAIHFYNSNGQCVLHEVCGYNCYSTYTGTWSVGQFAYIYVKNDASSKNYANYTSVTRCVRKNSDSYAPLWLQYGIIFCPSVNISMNECYFRSGIYCSPYGDSNSVTCSLLYSSFTDNIANGYTCIYFYRSGANYEIKSCNILRNTQGTLGSEGTFNTWGNTMITDSCILENTATYIFHQGSSYTITLSNCTVDSTSSNGYLTTQNTVTKSFILALNHMSTQNCHAEYGSTECPPPIIKIYNTCKRFFHQQGNFVPLASILVFNFIHPYASGDL